MIETVKLGTLRWSHLFRPTEDELQGLQNYYHFHPLDIEDCKSLVNLRPKIDSYQDYHFLILHFPVMDMQGEFLEARELKVFWGKDYLITIGKSHWLIKELLKQEQNESLTEQKIYVGSSDELLYKLLEYVMDDTRKLVDIVDKSVDVCGKELFSRKPEKTIEKISVTRKNVILLNTILKPQMVLFNKLQSGAIKGFADKMEDYWGNIMDSYQRAWDIIEDDRELIIGFSKTFDSLQVNKTHEIMRILTLMTSIFLPLTLIAVIYSLVIKYPVMEHLQSDLIVSGIMAVIALFVIIYFKIRRWM
ncbi:MAG: magnesium transporter CorA family protein [Bacteroidales bacterium]|jgi:magnesium transporter